MRQGLIALDDWFAVIFGEGRSYWVDAGGCGGDGCEVSSGCSYLN